MFRAPRLPFDSIVFALLLIIIIYLITWWDLGAVQSAAVVGALFAGPESGLSRDGIPFVWINQIVCLLRASVIDCALRPFTELDWTPRVLWSTFARASFRVQRSAGWSVKLGDIWSSLPVWHWLRLTFGQWTDAGWWWVDLLGFSVESRSPQTTQIK